jgi:hypothetical protein
MCFYFFNRIEQLSQLHEDVLNDEIQKQEALLLMYNSIKDPLRSGCSEDTSSVTRARERSAGDRSGQRAEPALLWQRCQVRIYIFYALIYIFLATL